MFSASEPPGGLSVLQSPYYLKHVCYFKVPLGKGILQFSKFISEDSIGPQGPQIIGEISVPDFNWKR